MKPIQVRLPERLLQAIDEKVEEQGYPNRAEVIRDAIRRHVQG